jgi:hypothetical protein
LGHHPDQLYSRNLGLLKMSKRKLHEFAKTKEKGLPQKKRPPRQSKASAKRQEYHRLHLNQR